MESISSPQIDNKIKNLEKKVAQYSPYKASSLKINYYMYIGIPVGIFFLLLILKPSFVMTEQDVLDTEKPSLNLSKVFMWSLVLGGILDIGVYVFNTQR